MKQRKRVADILNSKRSMDEIAEYKKQISSIDILLAENGEDEELIQTKKDLEELVELMMEEMAETPSSSGDNNEGENNQEEEDLLNLEDLLGTRCMAPFKSETSMRTHTAVIMDIQPGNDESSSKIRVLFSHPTCLAMKPCSHFLNSKCKFEDNCRFSHGYLIDLDKIEDYVEPNFDRINVDCLVLVKSSNDIWELGRISAMDGQLIAVKLLKTNQEISSTLENIMPVQDEPEEEKYTGEGSSWSELKGETLGNVGIQDVGKWEGGGIGMKLMMQMGYKIGQGLGKKSDGIVHAIQAKICPKNASVDECMNRKKRKVVDGKSDNINKKKVKKLETSDSSEKDIFAFINRKLEKSTNHSSFVDMKKEKEQLTSCSVKTLGVKGVDLDLELKQLKSKEKKLKEGISRNKNDKSTVARMTQTLKELEAEIESVIRKQNRVNSERNSRKMKMKDVF